MLILLLLSFPKFNCTFLPRFYINLFPMFPVMVLLCISEVILTLGRSRTVMEFLSAAKEKKRSFRVFVAEGAPRSASMLLALHIPLFFSPLLFLHNLFLSYILGTKDMSWPRNWLQRVCKQQLSLILQCLQ